MSVPRIFFDANTDLFDGGFPLVLDKSLADIRAVSGGLSEGMKVIIYENDDDPIEFEATIAKGDFHGSIVWVAIPVRRIEPRTL